MNREEYKAKRAEYMRKIETIKERVEREGRDLTADERLEVDMLLRSVESLDGEPTRQPIKPDPQSGISVGRDRSGLKPFESIGAQLRAIALASVPGGAIDSRLHEINQRAASGLNEGIGSEGGFIIQTDFSDSIMENLWENSPILSRIRRYEISGNSNSLTLNGVDETSRATGSRAGGVRGYWVAEAGEITSSKPAFRAINLKLNKAACLIYTTEEMLEDRSVLGSFIESAAAAEIDFMLTDGVINGDGAGKPLGILNGGCLVTVPKVSGQTDTTVVEANLHDMYARLLPSSLKNAVWIANKDTVPQLYSLSSDGSGVNPVFLPSGGLSGRPYSQILGLPLVFAEQSPTLGAAGDILLADLGQYVAISKALRTAWSMHVRFIYDEQVFKITTRFDGQPALASAITPFKGTATVSPFVALGARTS